MALRSFQHFTTALRLFHGPDSLAVLGRELDRLDSRRAVIVCGASLARDGSPLDRVRSAMAGRVAGVFDGVRPHSPLDSVEAAACELKRLDADAVIAVGGGSAIVTGRAAAILAAENADVSVLCTARDSRGELHSPRLGAPKIPQLVIPTTPTTAIAKAGSAIFDPVGGKRLALYDPKTRAHAVFTDPELVCSAPREVVVSASLNTLTMATEGLLSRAGNPFSDALLMHGLRLIGDRLPNLSSKDDASVRGDLVMAAVLCGQGTDAAGAGIAIVLGHAISARCHVDNGIANAIVLPHCLRFNAEAGRVGLAKLAVSLGLMPSANSETVIDAIGAIWANLGIPQRLREVGVPHGVLAEIAGGVMDDWFLLGNVRPVQAASELLQVLETAW